MNITANKEYPVIAWWSGGITSAMTCKLCLDWYGPENVRVVFIDTHNEDEDTYRFLLDCEQWYNVKIESISSKEYTNIKDVWYKYLSLNVAHGAICSTELKRKVREQFQKDNQFSHQAFGYEPKEWQRALAMKLNHPDTKPIFPLIYEILTKGNCGKIIQKNNIKLPRTYELGYHNNNCFKTKCVQGGIGYWQKVYADDRQAFDEMAFIEHDLSRLKGEPVTMLRDQAKDGGLLFLKHNPQFPDIKDISMKKAYPVKPLFECNGFCSTNDLNKNTTEREINYQITLPSPQAKN